MGQVKMVLGAVFVLCVALQIITGHYWPERVYLFCRGVNHQGFLVNHSIITRGSIFKLFSS